MRVSARVASAHLLFATCGSDHAVGREVVITVSRSVLLLFSRGYAGRAPQTRLAPRFDCARGVLAEIAADLLLATTGSLSRLGSLVVFAVGAEYP